MKVKKYVVDSMPDALQKIRADLGKDAVIINTKEVRVGGFLGLFAKKKVEVVAATDSNPESAPPRQPSPLRTDTPVVAKAQAATAATAAATAVAPVVRSAPAVEPELVKEIRQMKEMMQRLAASQTDRDNGGKAGVPPSLEAIRERLVEQDIAPAVADALIAQALALTEGAPPDEMSASEAREAVKSVIVDVLTKEPIEQIRTGSKIIRFVGPTGVGKTTTIAKIAAEQALKHRKSIGLITSDTYRIAAIEQLRTYASILNVPLEVVFSSADLQKALEKLQDRDLILMDTAGRNFRKEMAVSELNSLFRGDQEEDTFLVLSLSMKYSDMKAVTDNFYKFGVKKVLFTKADETASYGSIVNLLHDFPLSLSYVTDGQNVPDDINLADAVRIASEIAGDHDDE